MAFDKHAYYLAHRERLRKQNQKWYRRNRKELIEVNQNRIRSLREWFAEYKATLKCERCGENNPVCLSFHHRNGEEKEYAVATMIARGFHPQKVREEIQKCEVLCMNCHAKETARLRQPRKKPVNRILFDL